MEDVCHKVIRARSEWDTAQVDVANLSTELTLVVTQWNHTYKEAVYQLLHINRFQEWKKFVNRDIEQLLQGGYDLCG